MVKEGFTEEVPCGRRNLHVGAGRGERHTQGGGVEIQAAWA